MGELLKVRRILVVDDNVDAGALIGEIISTQGHAVLVVNSGREAIDTAAEFAPDVMFLDLGMPGIDGYEVATMLRKDHRFDAMRIVALTAWGDNDSRVRTTYCGFDAHLVKPANIESLFSEATLTRSGH